MLHFFIKLHFLFKYQFSLPFNFALFDHQVKVSFFLLSSLARQKQFEVSGDSFLIDSLPSYRNRSGKFVHFCLCLRVWISLPRAMLSSWTCCVVGCLLSIKLLLFEIRALVVFCFYLNSALFAIEQSWFDFHCVIFAVSIAPAGVRRVYWVINFALASFAWLLSPLDFFFTFCFH